MKTSPFPFLALFLLFSWTSTSIGESPEEFLQRYLIEGEKVKAYYEKVHMLARVEETVQGKEGIYDLERFQDGNKTKLIRRYVSGDRLYARDDVVVFVANPESSFDLRAKVEGSRFALSFLGKSQSDYDKTEESVVLGGGMLLRSPYYCIQMPLTKLLAMKETSVTKVTEEKAGGQDLKRVELRIRPFNEGLRKAVDHLDGWLLFEPSAHWVLRQFDISYWDKNSGQLHSRITGSLTYEDTAKEIPSLRQVQYEYFNGKGISARKYRSSVKSVEFGPISADNFTLSGSGLSESFAPRPRNHLPLLSFGVALLALIVIVVLRRRKSKGQRTQRSV